MDSIGDRMKNNYENRYRFYLTRRTPVIIRLDGKSFHTLTKNCVKPFDQRFMDCMKGAGTHTMNQIQGAKCVYIQSDEVSILLTDYDRLETDAWFDYNVQKISSVSASIITSIFNDLWSLNRPRFEIPSGIFDARVFNIPKEEVCNYFIWRQQDWIRNSIQMYARSFYSHKDLLNKNSSDIHEMLHMIGKNWVNDLTPQQKNGSFAWFDDDGYCESDGIVFTKSRSVIEILLTPKEE